jgi:hypothetical protein
MKEANRTGGRRGHEATPQDHNEDPDRRPAT